MTQLGDAMPNIELPATGDQQINLRDLKGKPVVLFFYPKASTPGCTKEGQAFRDLYPKFQKLGAEVIGASRDGVKAQENFKAKHDFPYPLLSDKEEELCNHFDVIKQKKMYGKDVRGIERSTFLFGADGKLEREWRKVKVDGHAEEVLEALRDL